MSGESSPWLELIHFWCDRNTNRSPLQLEISRQQLLLNAKSSPALTLGGALAVFVTFFLLKEHHSLEILSVWAAAQGGGVAFTLWLLSQARSARAQADPLLWHKRLGICAVYVGLMWGITSWIFLPIDKEFERDTLLVLISTVAIVALAGSTGLIYHRPHFMTVSIVCICSFALGLLRLGETLFLVTGISMFGLLGVLLNFNLPISTRILDSLRLAMEKESLLSEKEGLLVQLQERTSAAEQAKEKAEEASFVRLRFLSAASHDLRQPVHVIGLRASELLERIQYPEVRSIVEKIVQSTETLEERFDAILGAAQLQMGRTKPKIDDFPVSQLLSRIETSYAPQAQAHEIGFEVPPSAAVVRTDLNLLTSLVGNFVSNAIRYTREGKVLVRCRERGGFARIQVWDTGPGIKHGEFKAIFEEFVRLDHPGMQSRERGHGMGLAIVRGLAEALGLRVGVRSKVGKGSLFWVELPLVGSVLSDTGGHDLSALQANEKIAGSFVVIIDDEEEVLASHRSLLRQWGCHVVAATSARAALHELESHERIPDLILCDYQLGGEQTGIDAIRAVRAAQAHEIPAIILTGDITVLEQLQTALPQCTVITKPVRASKLRPVLLQSLGFLEL